MSEPQIHDPDLFGNPLVPAAGGELRRTFGQPPFTVLNSRDGPWMSRKKKWLRLGIRSELGRGDNPPGWGTTTHNKNFYKLKTELEEEIGRVLTTEEAEAELVDRGWITSKKDLPSLQKGGNGIGYAKVSKTTGNESSAKARAHYKEDRPRKKKGLTYGISVGGNVDNAWGAALDEDEDAGYGTSHFDPVLCELVYNWFCPRGGLVLDPFSGCSVSGMVAAYTGRRFYGIDLSASQVENNREVVSTLPAGAEKPVWVVGDSREKLPDAPEYDFLWSCPPYHDLEVYSSDARDISTMDWDDFREAYADIYYQAADRLRDDRFAAVVVGDVRDRKGNYRNLPAYTTAVFKKAGLELYNEMVLVTAVGSLSVRTPGQFTISRKAGKTHQNLLVYLKGDARRATDAVTGLTVEQRRLLLKQKSAARQNAVVGFKEDAAAGGK